MEISNIANATYRYTEIEYKSPITHIFHISDIHINLQAKHTEYKQVFNRLYDFLKNKKRELGIPDTNQNIPCLCFITGDILHSKTELLPECIELTRHFFESLSSIMPTLFMAGNHDLNINNESRLDGLTPIFNGISSNYPIHYLQNSGVYKFGNILFSVSSVRDYLIIPPELIKNPDECLKICAYHGRVNGVILYNGMVLDGELNKKLNKTVTPSSFDGYDFVLLGDIHKHQFMNSSKTIGYAGSLIQQNHGETLNNHGVLVWDLVKKTAEHHHIPNDYGYVSITIRDSKYDDICVNESNEDNSQQYIHNDNCHLPKNLHLRILLENTPYSSIQQVIALIKKYHNIIDITYLENTDNTIENNDKTNYNDNVSLDITEPAYQNMLIEKYLKDNSDVSDSIIDNIKNINTSANENISKEDRPETRVWKLIKLEFSNLYSYGPNNIIDFSDNKGIIGIIAPNHMGKSAILDIILYTLYDKFPRKGTLKDIINNRKERYHSRVIFQIEELLYVVEKSGMRKGNRTTSKTRFYRYKKNNPDIKEFLEEDTVSKTKNKILKYIGSYDDMIQTNISLQHNSCIFIDSENVNRRKELERILRINFIDELSKRATSTLNDNKAIYRHLQKKCIDEEVIKARENQFKFIKEITELDTTLEELKLKLNTTEKEIIKVNQKIIPNVSEILEELRKTIKINGSIKLKLESIYQTIVSEKSNKEQLTNELSNTNWLNKEHTQIEDEMNQVEEKHNEWIQIQQNKIKELDNNLEKLYKSRKPLILENKISQEEVDLTVEEANDMQKEIEDMKMIIQNLEEIEEEIENNNNKIEELKSSISKLNLNSLPSRLVDYIEGVSAMELEEDLENIEEDLSQDFIKNKLSHINETEKYNKWNEVNNELAIYRYLEDYQDKEEQNNNIRTNQLTEIEELSVKNTEKKMVASKMVGLKKNMEKKHNIYNDLLETIKKQKQDLKNMEFNKKISLEIDDIKKRKVDVNLEEDVVYLEHKSNYNKIRSIWNCNNKIKELELESKNIEVNGGRIEVLEQQEKYNLDLETEIDKMNDEKRNIITEMKIIEDRLNNVKSMFVSNNTKIDALKKDINEMKKIEMNISTYTLYLNALKGIPLIIIERVKTILEKKINDLLSITTNFMVKIEIDGTRIEIYLDRPVYNGKLILLNNASGFERFISSLAIRLALLDISQLPKPNFMAIDEGWNSFDYNNINNVRIIFDFLVQKVDFVLSISHVQSIRQHCDSHISLDKDNYGYSIIRSN